MIKWLLISLLIHCGIMLALIKEPTKQQSPIIVEIKPISRTPKSVSSLPKQSVPNFNIEKEVEQGRNEAKEENLLLRKENIYKNYFDRIRQEVEPRWQARLKEYFKTHTLDKTTTSVVVIIIDTNGVVVKIILAESCGNTDLDKFAMDAFQGRIFPNPPKGLTNDDGYGRIPWSFVIRRR